MTTPVPQHPVIDWKYPEPRHGLDRFIGPGATSAEILLQVLPSLVAALGMTAAAVINQWGWSPVQLLVVGVLVIDMVGGVITNATSTGKRWYHREGQGAVQHLIFILIHIIQPLLIMLFFSPGNWMFVLGSFGYLVLAALLILATPLYLQRPLAGLLLVIGFFLALYGLPVPAHFEWFLPVYYTKLLSSHLLREEPYRPQ